MHFKHFNRTNFLLELESLSNLNLGYRDPSESWAIWKNTFLDIINELQNNLGNPKKLGKQLVNLLINPITRIKK